MNNFSKLKLNKEFRRVYGRGKSFVHPTVVTYVATSRFDGCRIGITTGKKIGCAVKRNRARRIILAAFRECVPYINCNCDIVFVARTRLLNCKSTELKEVLLLHLKEAGVIDEKTADSTD